MTNLNLIILSYHQFTDDYNDYKFSRMYSRFREDLDTKVFDVVTVDDAHWSSRKAFEMMRDRNHRGILFVPTSLIGEDGYLTWKEISLISQFHEIGNHSHNHINLQKLSLAEVKDELIISNMLIEKHTGKKPRFFVPPFNKYNNYIDNVAEKFGMQIIKNRLDILNDTP